MNATPGSKKPGKTLDGGFSTASSKKKQKKKKIDPLSLEEVFNQVTTVTASNMNPTPGRVVLTPRSAEGEF